MTRELDGVELGQHAAGSLLAEQAPDDGLRERHVWAVAELAVSLAWARYLAQVAGWGGTDA